MTASVTINEPVAVPHRYRNRYLRDGSMSSRSSSSSGSSSGGGGGGIDLSKYLTKAAFEELFVKDTSSGTTVIKANYSLYSVGGISAFGNGTSGSGGTGGSTEGGTEGSDNELDYIEDAGFTVYTKAEVDALIAGLGTGGSGGSTHTHSNMSALNKLSLDANGRLKIDCDVYATGGISAFGDGTSGSTGGGGSLTFDVASLTLKENGTDLFSFGELVRYDDITEITTAAQMAAINSGITAADWQEVKGRAQHSHSNMSALNKLSLDANGRLKIDCDVYATGGISAFGDGIQTTVDGVTSFSQLNEVKDTTFSNGQTLVYQNGSWVAGNTGSDLNKSAVEAVLTGNITSHTHDYQPIISDLDTIRSGAALGATALQSYTETDPVFCNWRDTAKLTLWGNSVDVNGGVCNGDLTWATQNERTAQMHWDINALWVGITKDGVQHQPIIMWDRSEADKSDMTQVYELYSLQSGKVGIGIDNPTDKLEVSGNTHIHGALKLTNGSNTVTLEVDNDGNLKINGDAYATGALSAFGGLPQRESTTVARLDIGINELYNRTDDDWSGDDYLYIRPDRGLWVEGEVRATSLLIGQDPDQAAQISGISFNETTKVLSLKINNNIYTINLN